MHGHLNVKLRSLSLRQTYMEILRLEKRESACFLDVSTHLKEQNFSVISGFCRSVVY